MKTFTQNLADPNCGMNKQAAAFLRILAAQTFDAPGAMWIRTLPYCNCREMGFVLSVRKPKGKSVNIAFYEHRNSDSFCALRWEGDIPISGAVTAADVTGFTDKWDVSKSWGYLQFSEAEDYVRETVQEIADLWIAHEEKKAEKTK